MSLLCHAIVLCAVTIPPPSEPKVQGLVISIGDLRVSGDSVEVTTKVSPESGKRESLVKCLINGKANILLSGEGTLTADHIELAYDPATGTSVSARGHCTFDDDEIKGSADSLEWQAEKGLLLLRDNAKLVRVIEHGNATISAEKIVLSRDANGGLGIKIEGLGKIKER